MTLVVAVPIFPLLFFKDHLTPFEVSFLSVRGKYILLPHICWNGFRSALLLGKASHFEVQLTRYRALWR